MSDLSYRSSISISHIDIGSYLVTLLVGGACCGGGSLTAPTLATLPGFWRREPNATAWHRCLNQQTYSGSAADCKDDEATKCQVWLGARCMPFYLIQHMVIIFLYVSINFEHRTFITGTQQRFLLHVYLSVLYSESNDQNPTVNSPFIPLREPN